MKNSPRKEFARLMRLPEEDLDLAEAALLVAAAEYPGLDIESYRDQLEAHTRCVHRRLYGDTSPERIIYELNSYLFDEQGFEGNLDDYYDPRNSFLNDVLDRRMGAPISLCLIYLEIGRRLGLPLRGVSFPGHFLVKFTMSGKDVVLDPFLKGTALNRDELEHRLDELFDKPGESRPPLKRILAAVEKKEILVRMLRNLKAVYFQTEEFEKALAISRFIFDAIPDTPVEVRDRGTIYLRMECFRAALSDYRDYLKLHPEADDMDEIREQLIDLEWSVARLN